ncbi:hypothetical protein [Devosia sp. MC521]|uniref:hypothetical protein n=1 Tax=Devosia sp. MC521 TaxID=2759954 RepID=UPI0015FB9256|nr:hypothetical protein [Devosia sp. MC521]MBJ6986045.1 hypothetical protein [Devosia sp. MC521]QMW61415.1 hypothetical protein H4N61_10515 [Devosia sp. MC521]
MGTKTKPAPRQLDLFASMPAPAVAAKPPGPSLPLANYGPWPGLSARSWMHMFALERHTDGRVYTIHPAFDDAPWLDAHAKDLGYRPVYAECMAERRHQGEARFAGEFCNTAGWRELMANRHLTTPRWILEHVARGLHYSLSCEPRFRLDHGSARAIMLELGSVDPGVGTFSDEDMIVAVCEQVFFNTDDLEELTWQRIHAWQLGLVRYRKSLAEPVEQRKSA